MREDEEEEEEEEGVVAAVCLQQPSLLAGNWLGNQQARPTHCHW